MQTGVLVPNGLNEMVVNSRIGGDPLFIDAPIASIFLIVPVILLALASPLLLALRWRPDLTPVLALMVTIFLGAVLTLLLISATHWISVRYTADVVPQLTMVASLMLLLLVNRYRIAAGARRRSVGQRITAYLVAFTILSTIPSVLLGLSFGLVAWGQAIPPLQ
jgi:hypothetical protein